MAKHDHRAMSPPPQSPQAQARRRRAPPAPQRQADDDDDGPRRPLLVYALLTFLVVAMGGFLWSAYDDGPTAGIVRVTPDRDSFKERGPDVAEPSPRPPVEDVLRAPEIPTDVTETAAPPEQPMAQDANPAPTGAPIFANNGPFVAQIAALQSEGGIAPLWRRLSDRAPDLFADARMDVQRADLGASGVFLRVRVGYFADRDNAARFCVRMRAMGQDCMAVER